MNEQKDRPRRARRAYQPPKVDQHHAFETLAMTCAKTFGEFDCEGGPVKST